MLSTTKNFFKSHRVIKSKRDVMYFQSANILQNYSPLLTSGDENFANIPKQHNHSPLTSACWNADLRLVKSLIEDEGVDPNEENYGGVRPIHYCAMKNSGYPLLVYFFERGLAMDINVGTSVEGTTALMFASYAGLSTTVQLLLYHKAEVNKEDVEGKSALYYAVMGGRLTILRLLVINDGYWNLRDNNNGSLLHQLFGYEMTVTSFIRILPYLVEELEMDVNAKMVDGTTPLHRAVETGVKDVAEYLIEKGADVEAKRNFWESPLWTLVKSKNGEGGVKKDLIMLLFIKGANFQLRNPLGMSLMDYATKCLGNNGEVSNALEDVERILRRRRMEAMRVKRKAIWNSEGKTSPVVRFSSPPLSPIGSQADTDTDPAEVYLHLVENSGSAYRNGRCGGKSKGDKRGTSDSSCSTSSSSSSRESSSGESSGSSTSDDDFTLVKGKHENIDSIEKKVRSWKTEDNRAGMTTRQRKKVLGKNENDTESYYNSNDKETSKLNEKGSSESSSEMSDDSDTDAGIIQKAGSATRWISDYANGENQVGCDLMGLRRSQRSRRVEDDSEADSSPKMKRPKSQTANLSDSD